MADSGLDELLAEEPEGTSGLDEILSAAPPGASGLDEIMAPAVDDGDSGFNISDWMPSKETLAGVGVGAAVDIGLTGLGMALAPATGGLSVPLAIAAGAGLAGGLAGRATTDVLQGETPLHDYGLGDAAFDTLAGPALMGAGRLIRGARVLDDIAPAGVASNAGPVKVTAEGLAAGDSRLGSVLPESTADKIAKALPNLGDTVNPEILKSDLLEVAPKGLGAQLRHRGSQARRIFSSASALGRAHSAPEMKVAADALDTFGATERRLLEDAKREVTKLKRLRLTDHQWELVRAARRKDAGVSTAGFSDEMMQALRGADDIFAGADTTMREVGHVLRTKDGKLLAYDEAVPLDTADRYWPMYGSDEWVERSAKHTTRDLKSALNKSDFRRDFAMGERVVNLADADQLHPLKAIERYVDDTMPKVAATYAFGPQAQGEALSDFGSLANRLMSSFAEKGFASNRDRYTFAAMQDALNEVYKWKPITEADSAAEMIRRGMSTSQLGLAPWRQVGQLGTTIWQQGPMASLRGALDVASDPAARSFIRESGAVTQQMTDFMTLKGMGLPRMLGGAEKALRMHSAAAGMRRVKYLAKKAAQQAGTKKGMTAAVRKQLAEEFGLDADKVAREGLDAKDLATAAQWIADRLQFQTYAKGQSGTQMLTNPLLRHATQYRPFAGSATRLAIEDIGKPLLSGDASLMGLGLKRALTLPGAVGATAGLGEILAAAAGGREPEMGNAAKYAASTAIGTPADIIGDYAQGYGAVGSMFPAFQQLGRIEEDALGGHPLRAITRAAGAHPWLAPITPALLSAQR